MPQFERLAWLSTSSRNAVAVAAVVAAVAVAAVLLLLVVVVVVAAAAVAVVVVVVGHRIPRFSQDQNGIQELLSTGLCSQIP